MFKVSRGTISPIKPKGTARMICKIKGQKINGNSAKGKNTLFRPRLALFFENSQAF